MATNIKTYNGIVIRATDYGETSKILTVFTYEKGIVSIMAKGVKNPKSKKQNLTSIYTQAKFEISESLNNQDLLYLNSGIIIKDNLELRKNIKKVYVVQIFFDIIERLIIKNNPNEEVYKMTQKAILFATKTNNEVRLLNMFLIKIISIVGYKPVLYKCVKCGNVNLREVKFAYKIGGIICQNCTEKDYYLLSNDEYVYVKFILGEVFDKIDDIDYKIDEKKILEILMNFITFNIDITMPKSYISFIKLIGIK